MGRHNFRSIVPNNSLEQLKQSVYALNHISMFVAENKRKDKTFKNKHFTGKEKIRFVLQNIFIQLFKIKIWLVKCVEKLFGKK